MSSHALYAHNDFQEEEMKYVTTNYEDNNILPYDANNETQFTETIIHILDRIYNERSELKDNSSFLKNLLDDSNSTLNRLCVDILSSNEVCSKLYNLFNEENYLMVTWGIFTHFISTPTGIILFTIWTLSSCCLNLFLMFICLILKPLRLFVLTKIISDLRRRYYFAKDSTELQLDFNNLKK